MNEVLCNLQKSSECVCDSEGGEGRWRLNPVAILFKYIIDLFFITRIIFMCAYFFPAILFDKNISILKDLINH